MERRWNNLAIENVSIMGYNPAIVTDSQWWTGNSGGRGSAIAGLTMGDNIFEDITPYTVVEQYDYAIIPCGESEIRIKVRTYESGGWYYVVLNMIAYTNGVQSRDILGNGWYMQFTSVVPEWSIAFGIDRDNEAGYITIYQFDYGDTYYSNAASLACTRKQLYDLLINADQPVLYNWSAVPSLIGKDGETLSLAQIKEDFINDGDSVSGAPSSNFSNFKSSNRVDTLIDLSLPEPEVGGTTVTVKYSIPSISGSTYDYCKLVIKKNSMPEAVDDGDKIIDLDPTQSSKVVRNLRGKTKYYFEIFVKTTDDYEAVSNVKSITTGEVHDIILFTDEFNDDILVDNWDITVYRSGWGNGSSNWNPSQFASDFLTAYNFLIGNASRRTVWDENGEITAAQATSMTDGTFWIPIKRSVVPEDFKIEFDGKVSPLGSSDYSYNYVWVAVGCVDENNGWHQSAYYGGLPGQDWVHYESEVTGWQYGYIDYIGISDCDGKPHWKNIKIVV